jgi:hypothetical protein
MKTTILISVLIFCKLLTLSQDIGNKNRESLIKGVKINFEQDFLLEYLGLSNLNSDRNYTQGAGLSIYTKTISPISNLMFPIQKLDPFEHNLIYPSEISLRLGAFTPDDLRESNPIVGDRPYSTIFLFGVNSSLLQATSHKFTKKGIYIGVLGIDGPAEYLQTKIHMRMNENNTKDPYNPMGWHNQISNGGEFTFLFTSSKATLITKQKLNDEILNGTKHNSKRINLVVSYNYGYNIGYITDVCAGLSVKYGKIDLSNWASDLFNDLSITAYAWGEQREKERDYYSKEKEAEIYLFASLNPSLLIYNGSLHGGFRKSIYRLPYNETGFINSQARFGLAWTSKHHSLSVYWAFKSPEMWNSFSRIHSWGGFLVSVFWK